MPFGKRLQLFLTYYVVAWIGLGLSVFYDFFSAQSKIIDTTLSPYLPFISDTPQLLHLNVFALILLCCVVSIIPTILLLFFKNRLSFVLIIFCSISGVLGWSWAVQQFNIFIPVFYVFESVVVGTLIGVFLKMIYSSVEKDFLRAAFTQFVSEDMLKELLKDPNKLRLTSKEYEITVLFLDIRGFTAFSEKKSPAIVVTRLNELLDIVTKVIIQHDGTVDKYIGDAVMAFWGAPSADKKQATKACKAAIEICKKIEKETDFKVGIGINFGKAIIGNIGSSKRFDYTAIGDTVNTASRIEGLTKSLEQHIIVSESVVEKIKAEQGSIKTEDLGQVLVKGKNVKIHVHGIK